VRWVSGQWLPSWHQLLANRFFGAYVLVSATVGAAVTYIYDDRRNEKVNTLITVSFIGDAALNQHLSAKVRPATQASSCD
jgi:hypothetical protein